MAPDCPVIDLSHGIPPFAVEAGAAMVVRCLPHLGPGVVLAVVDPGVGTDRRAVAVGVPGRGVGQPDPSSAVPPPSAPRPLTGPTWLVGPDNGLLVPAAAALGGAARVIVLGGPEGPVPYGRTFDGRDVFAPAAAHLATGGRPGDLGPDADPASLVPLPPAVPGPGAWPDASGPGGWPGTATVTTVTWVDRFGNVQLDLDSTAAEGLGLSLGATAWVQLGDLPSGGEGGGAGPGRPLPARWVTGFGELRPGELGLVVDGAGRMALVLDRAPAATRLGPAQPGRAVRLSSTGPDPR
jgi:S-adenosylmethionine hydrolase